MYLDAEVIAVGMGCGEGDQRLAVAEADLERARGVAAEDGYEIERTLAGPESVARPEFLPGALLCRCHAARAHDEAPHGTLRSAVRYGTCCGIGVVWHLDRGTARVAARGQPVTMIRRATAPGSD